MKPYVFAIVLLTYLSGLAQNPSILQNPYELGKETQRIISVAAGQKSTRPILEPYSYPHCYFHCSSKGK